jgi:hypothetical protein
MANAPNQAWLGILGLDHRNRLNFEPTLIPAFTKSRPRIEVLEGQKLAQSSN